MNALSAILCLIAVLLEIGVFILVKDLLLYGDENGATEMTEYRPITIQNPTQDQSQIDGVGERKIDQIKFLSKFKPIIIFHSNFSSISSTATTT